MSAFTETDEHRELRAAVATRHQVRAGLLPGVPEGRKTDELWDEAGKLRFIGVNLPKNTVAAGPACTNCRS